MSKLQLRKFKQLLVRMIGPIELVLIHLFLPPIPAKREFIGTMSPDLFDTVRMVVGMKEDYRLIACTLGGKEFDPGLEEFDRLIQRAMVELVRRGDLTVGSMSYLIRLVNDDEPSDLLERAS